MAHEEIDEPIGEYVDKNGIGVGIESFEKWVKLYLPELNNVQVEMLVNKVKAL